MTTFSIISMSTAKFLLVLVYGLFYFSGAPRSVYTRSKSSIVAATTGSVFVTVLSSSKQGINRIVLPQTTLCWAFCNGALQGAVYFCNGAFFHPTRLSEIKEIKGFRETRRFLEQFPFGKCRAGDIPPQWDCHWVHLKQRIPDSICNGFCLGNTTGSTVDGVTHVKTIVSRQIDHGLLLSEESISLCRESSTHGVAQAVEKKKSSVLRFFKPYCQLLVYGTHDR